MSKKLVLMIYLFLGVSALCIIVAGITHWFNRTKIETDALVGINPITTEIIWSEDLSKWTNSVPKGSKLSIFRAELPDNQSQFRAIISYENHQQYIGRLSYQFDETPIQTVLISIQDDIFIFGWVDYSVNGHLTFVNLRREEPNSALWLEATKSSTVKNRIFFIPIFNDETNIWSSISRIGIKTRESSDEAWDSNTSDFYAWENTFATPIEISPLLTPFEVPGDIHDP